MIFRWETEDERLRLYMKIPPKKKLEWLYQMHQLSIQSPAVRRALRRRFKGKQIK